MTVAGMGGLGSCSSLLLAAAGVGHITNIDSGVVELSNLNRQVLYCDKDLGREKVTVARKVLSRLNPKIEVVPVSAKKTGGNVSSLIKDAQVVVDGMDNLPDRMNVNEACVRRGVPFGYGGIYGLRGMVSTIIPRITACLACICSQIPESSRVIPVLGTVSALVGELQALETVKLLSGIGTSLADKMLFFDGGHARFHYFSISKDKNCEICSEAY